MNTIRFFGLASIAVSVIANAGCAAPSEPSAGEIDGMEQVAADEMALANHSAGCHDDDEVDFSYTEIGPSQYVTIDALAALFETEAPLFKAYVEASNP